MTTPMPADAPLLIRLQAKMTALDYACRETLREHDRSAFVAGLKQCPCSFCRRVRPWVSAEPQERTLETNQDQASA